VRADECRREPAVRVILQSLFVLAIRFRSDYWLGDRARKRRIERVDILRHVLSLAIPSFHEDRLPLSLGLRPSRLQNVCVKERACWFYGHPFRVARNCSISGQCPGIRDRKRVVSIRRR
jgi:hypothetical protein